MVLQLFRKVVGCCDESDTKNVRRVRHARSVPTPPADGPGPSRTALLRDGADGLFNYVDHDIRVSDGDSV
jgi:hypothetical protein